MSSATRIINPAVADLFRRVKQLESPDGGWNGADSVEVLCEWLADHGINPDGGLDQLAGVGVESAPGAREAVATAEPYCNHDEPATREQTMTVCECGDQR